MTQRTHAALLTAMDAMLLDCLPDLVLTLQQGSLGERYRIVYEENLFDLKPLSTVHLIDAKGDEELTLQEAVHRIGLTAAGRRVIEEMISRRIYWDMVMASSNAQAIYTYHDIIND